MGRTDMRTLVVASSKGGVGKTTLAAALAVEASAKHRVAIMDLDPQQSLARWHDIRVAADSDADPDLIEVGKRPEVDIARALKGKFDWLIIDTPAGSLVRTKLAVDVADLVVIPVRPSPLDVEAVNATVELCDACTRNRILVLNGTGPKSAMTAGARSYLSSRYGGVLDCEIGYREVHAAAMVSGETAAELEAKGPAAIEIRTLWAAIEQAIAAPPVARSARQNKSAS